jgi:hypothetical protein
MTIKKTALHIERGQVNSVTMLVSDNANRQLTMVDKQGETPFDVLNKLPNGSYTHEILEIIYHYTDHPSKYDF